MKKYYIYLNGQQYMEMPKEYNIKKDVYMNFNDMIDNYMRTYKHPAGKIGTTGYALPAAARIHIQSKMFSDPVFLDSTVRHELAHIQQGPKKDYGLATQLLGYYENPYEIEARDWGERDWIPLHRIGTSDIKYQKALQQWQKEYPDVFKAWAKYQKKWTEKYKRGDVMPGYAEQKTRSEQNLKTAIKQVKKHGGEPKIAWTMNPKEGYLTEKQVEILKIRLNKFMK